MKDLYAILKIDPSVSSSGIDEAYMRQKKEAVAAGDNTSDYDFAYSILGNASKRQEYDIGMAFQVDTAKTTPETTSGDQNKTLNDERFREPWELEDSKAFKDSPLKRSGGILGVMATWLWRNHFVIWGLVLAAALVFLLIRVLSVEQSKNNNSNLFEQSLAQRTDLRLIPGFNEAMCETLDAAGPEKTCEKIIGVLNNLAKEIAIYLPNQDKGFTFQINCMVAVDQADGIKKCQEGVLMALFDDNSMTVVHFRNSDLDYLIGASKRVYVEHPMIGSIYAGKGKYSKNLDLPELAVKGIYGFNEEYASGTHRNVLFQARRDSTAEIMNVAQPTFVSYVAE